MTTVGYDIEVDGRQAETEIRKVDNSLARLKATGDRTSTSIDKLNNEIKSAATGMVGADQRLRVLSSSMAALQASFGAFSAIQAARQLISVGTAADSLNRQFEAVFRSSGEAARQMAFIRAEAIRLGLSVQSAANDFALLSASTIGTSLEGEKTRMIFSAIAEASAKLGLSAETTSGTLVAFRQIASGATLQTEELNQISERIPGTFRLAAAALGVTTGEVKKLIADGKVATDEFLPKFAAELRRAFGTDANARIESVASNFARLRTEIVLTAQELAKRPTATAGTVAGFAADFLRRGRLANELEGLGPDAQRRFRLQRDEGLRSGGRFASLEQFVKSERSAIDGIARALTGSGRTAFDVASLLEIPGRGGDPLLPGLSGAAGVSSRSSLSGVDLLTSGQKPAEAAREEREQRSASLKIATDQQRLDVDRSNTIYQMIRDTQDQTAELKRQLETGESLTAAGRELARLRNGDLDFLFRGREAAKALLATELERAVALERSAAASELANDAARRAADQLRSGPGAAGAAQRLARAARRGIPLSLDDIGAQVADARVFETDRFQKQVADLRGGDEATFRREGRLKENQTINDLIEQAAQEHQEELTQIEANGQLARQTLMRAQLDVAAEIFGGLANLAQVFGKRGFAIYKAAAIAEATISTIKGAKGAFDRANEAYPPPFGAIAGAASAAIVTASGFAQIARIRAQQYGGGREFGGPVSDSQFYEIGERGKPEIINSDGRYYLFGAQGNVIPASSSTQAGAPQVPGGNVSIVVNNMAGDLVNAQARSSRGLNGDQVIELVVAQLSDNASPIGRSVARKTGVRGQGVIG